MLRISGVNIPDKKHIIIGLQAIFGIGRPRALQLCEQCDIDPATKGTALTEAQIESLRDAIAKVVVEGDLRRQVQMRIKHLKDIKCYRGSRHHRRLPARGQRTRTNARTVRRGRAKRAA